MSRLAYLGATIFYLVAFVLSLPGAIAWYAADCLDRLGQWLEDRP